MRTFTASFLGVVVGVPLVALSFQIRANRQERKMPVSLPEGYVMTDYGVLPGCAICRLASIDGPLVCEHGVCEAISPELGAVLNHLEDVAQQRRAHL